MGLEGSVPPFVELRRGPVRAFSDSLVREILGSPRPRQLGDAVRRAGSTGPDLPRNPPIEGPAAIGSWSEANAHLAPAGAFWAAVRARSRRALERRLFAWRTGRLYGGRSRSPASPRGDRSWGRAPPLCSRT